MEKAVQIKNTVLVVLSVVGSAISGALGGWDSALKVLIGLMACDYITGLLLAALWKNSTKSETGALDSRAGFKGLVKKGVMLMVVWVGVMVDTAMGVAYVRTAVVLFFIGNEGISLLENIGLMGVPYPAFLKNALEQLRSKGDEGKDATV